MHEAMAALARLVGDYEGEGVNHEGQPYRGRLALSKRLDGAALALEAEAVGADGTVYHREWSTIAPRPDGALGLWVASNNHPGVVEHVLDPAAPAAPGAERTFAFRHGDPAGTDGFREVVSFDLWPGGDLTHRYAWGLPGGPCADRSGARLRPGRERAIPEARLVETPQGLVPEGEGWFVLNLDQARWAESPRFGRSCGFEGERRFAQLGINVHVLEPGQPACHYHGEADQEDFLVLEGECTVLIEGQERRLRAGDLVHCPPWTRHVFLGAGRGPCAILMVGGRTRQGVHYPLEPLARRAGAAAPHETDSPAESYAACPPWSAAPPRWPLRG